jgi:20S proteasome subunit alpha 2
MAERYSSTSLTTFSPSGKLVQIEYALAAVAGGSPSVGIKATNGIVLAAEKKLKSILYDESTISKIENASEHIGITYSGMGPDFRVLVTHARRIAESYYLTYKERIPISQLVQELAYTIQEYTQSRGVRPFGVSLLVAGWDEDKPYLFQCDPSGAYFPWKATALGKNHINGKTFLEKRCVCVAVLCVTFSVRNCEVASLVWREFRIYTVRDIKTCHPQVVELCICSSGTCL